MNNRDQTVGVLEKRVGDIAREERWPAGLLPRVQLALAGADPAGLDSRATRADWYAAAYEAIADVPTSQAEADALQTIFALATGGASAFAEEQAGIAGQIKTQADVAADAIVDGLDTAADVITSPWTYVAAAAAAAAVAWAVLKK